MQALQPSIPERRMRAEVLAVGEEARLLELAHRLRRLVERRVERGLVARRASSPAAAWWWPKSGGAEKSSTRSKIAPAAPGGAASLVAADGREVGERHGEVAEVALEGGDLAAPDRERRAVEPGAREDRGLRRGREVSSSVTGSESRGGAPPRRARSSPPITQGCPRGVGDARDGLGVRGGRERSEGGDLRRAVRRRDGPAPALEVNGVVPGAIRRRHGPPRRSRRPRRFGIQRHSCRRPPAARPRPDAPLVYQAPGDFRRGSRRVSSPSNMHA